MLRTFMIHGVALAAATDRPFLEQSLDMRRKENGKIANKV
jgi:hypothetical protein